MKVVYVAGPIRAENSWLRELNIRKAEMLALDAWKAGAAVICPHAMGRFYTDDDYPMWIAGDLEIISRCDALLMVNGWDQSLGAKAERAEAMLLGKKICYSLDELIEWLSDEKHGSWSS